MERKIVDFKLDDAGDWTAILSCGHPQHTRHRPPFENRNWVLSQEGRESKIGAVLNCVRCDEFELPTGVTKFKVTSEFTEESLPAGLRSAHQTKSGIWGKIVILEGELLYSVESKNLEVCLGSDRPGVIVPELTHSIEPAGKVRLYIEFYKSDNNIDA